MNNATDEDSRPAGPEGSAGAVFQEHRERLWGIAYGILSSPEDADDLVQEAYVRWHRSDHQAVEQPEAWLVTTVTRLGIDWLRARQKERSVYIGPWLPTPVVDPAPPSDRGDADDYESLLEVLAPEASYVTDGGGKAWAARNEVKGADRVARCVLGVARKRKAAGRMEDRMARINGEPGILTYLDGVAISATVLALEKGRIRSIYRVLNPDKLGTVPPLTAFDADLSEPSPGGYGFHGRPRTREG